MESTRPKQNPWARGDANTPGFAETLAKASAFPRAPKWTLKAPPLDLRSMETAAGMTARPSVPTPKGFPRMQDFWCQSLERSQAHWEGLLTVNS